MWMVDRWWKKCGSDLNFIQEIKMWLFSYPIFYYVEVFDRVHSHTSAQHNRISLIRMKKDTHFLLLQWALANNNTRQYTFSLSNTLGIACQVLIGDSKSEESVRMCIIGVLLFAKLTEGVEMVTIGATIREFCVIFRSRMHLFFIFICRISIILSTSARMRLLRVKIID